jgi:hypothetical protein
MASRQIPAGTHDAPAQGTDNNSCQLRKKMVNGRMEPIGRSINVTDRGERARQKDRRGGVKSGSRVTPELRASVNFPEV